MKQLILDLFQSPSANNQNNYNISVNPNNCCSLTDKEMKQKLIQSYKALKCALNFCEITFDYGFTVQHTNINHK